MTRYILHIGTHKTGTTSIQKFLAESRESLLESGIDFPLIGRSPQGAQAHRHIGAWFRGLPDDCPPGFAETLRRPLTALPTCIISDEALYKLKKRSQVEAVKSCFGGDTLVFCYLREPSAHLQSLYSEFLKSRRVAEFEEFVQQHADALSRDRGYSYYHYDRNLDLWRTCFEVDVARYAGGTDVVQDFSRRCGIAASLWSNAALTENQSLSPSARGILLTLNRWLLAGKLDVATWKSAFRALCSNPNSQALDLHERLPRRTSDLRPFLKLFVMRNRKSRDLADMSPSELEIPFVDRETEDLIAEMLVSQDIPLKG